MASDCGNVQKVFVPVDNEKKKEVAKEAISGVEISDLSAEKILHFLQKENKSPEKYGLKVKVVKDGCSGNSYQMDLGEIDEAKANGDKLFEKNGATVIIEKLSYLFVIGSRLDYAESMFMSGFQLNNPNVKGSCSCGSSFRV